MRVHVRSTDGDIAADELGRVPVWFVGGVVAPVHLQHRLLHHWGLDDFAPIHSTQINFNLKLWSHIQADPRQLTGNGFWIRSKFDRILQEQI